MNAITISLTNFRNIAKKRFTLHNALTIIVGKNAIGKTNLLESIYFISRGAGFRESKRDELIKQSETQCIVEGIFSDKQDDSTYRIVLENSITIKKAFFVNKIKKRLFDYVKLSAKVIIFSPILMYVIDGQPGERREFIDKIIGNIDIEYKKRLQQYEVALRKRNKLLEKERNITKLHEELPFWDTFLIDQARYITKKRDEFTDFLHENKSLDTALFTIHYIKNEMTKERLESTFEKQLYAKKTLVGPQRDDFEIEINKGNGFKNVHRFGSRSEQRLALFWLLLNELKLIENTFKQKPIILLDDIFSELDIDNKSLIIRLITNYQTVITTTEEHIEDLIHLPHAILRL